MKKIFGMVLFCIITIGATAQSIDWSRAPGSNPSNINPRLAAALILLGQQTNTRIIPNQGYRTYQEQYEIGERMIRENPGFYRDAGGTVRNSQGQARVAAPGSPLSLHETGNAVDINRDGVANTYYTEAELNRAGLTADPSITRAVNEPWHVTLK